MEDQQIVDWRARVTDFLREGVGGLHGKARPEQAVVNRDIAERDGTRRGVGNLLAEAEILEEISRIGLWYGVLGHGWLAHLIVSFIRSARRSHSHKTVRQTLGSYNGKLMRTCLDLVLAIKSQTRSIRGRTRDEKDHSAFCADCGRFGHRPAGACGFRRRHEEGHHVQGHHVQGCHEEGRDEEGYNEEGRDEKGRNEEVSPGCDRARASAGPAAPYIPSNMLG